MATCTECLERVAPGAATCDACGAAVAPPSVERRGGEFIVHRGAVLPPMCVKCGAPAEHGKVRSFYWHPPIIYITILAGLLVYVIVAICVRKRFEIAVPVCGEHLRRRRTLYWVGTGLLVLSVALVAATFVSKSDDLGAFACIGAVVSLLAGLIVFAVAGRSISPKEITDEYAKFAGACPAFLEALN